MPGKDQPSDAGDATTLTPPSSAAPLPATQQIVGADTPVIAVAGDAMLTALADDLEYTLTVGQALERMIASGRNAPSPRSIQRYCIEGRLAAQKIRTTFGSEWLINESSLAHLIETEPVVIGTAGDARTTNVAAPASPTHTEPRSLAPDTNANSVASAAEYPLMAAPEGERRTVAEVLIENARLLAEVEGRDAIITELRDDKNFLREEVRAARSTREDVKNIAERMLDTLKTMAIGRLAAASQPFSPDPLRATVVEPDNPER